MIRSPGHLAAGQMDNSSSSAALVMCRVWINSLCQFTSLSIRGRMTGPKEGAAVGVVGTMTCWDNKDQLEHCHKTNSYIFRSTHMKLLP